MLSQLTISNIAVISKSEITLEAQEKNADSIEYQVARSYEDINQELLYMTSFDSFWKNDPGYGISIPVTGEETGFDAHGDRWYCFE